MTKTLKKNNDYLQLDIQKSSNPVLVIDHDGNFLVGNKSACEFLECSLVELLTKNICDYFPSNQSDDVMVYHHKLWQEGGTVETVYEINGKLKTLLLSVSPGQYKGKDAVFGFGVDVTEQNQYKVEIFKSNQRSKWLYDNAPIPYHILNPDGVIKDVNQRWCDVLGYSRNEVIGKEIFGFISIDEREDARKSFLKKKSSKQLFIKGSDRKYISKDGNTRIFRTFDYYVYDKENQPISIQTTIEDITEIKATEEQQQRNLNRLKILVGLFEFEYSETQDFLDYVLIESINLTSSKAGFIYFYDANKKKIEIKSWHPMKKTFRKKNLVLDLEKVGPLGDPIRSGKNVIVNNYKRANSLLEKLQSWHIGVKRFLAIPIKESGNIVAVICVANKDKDYVESDTLQLSLLLESAWRIKTQRETMEALGASERLLRNLINGTEDIVLIKDENLRIILANQAALSYYGAEAEEVINKTVFDLTPEENAKITHTSDEYAMNENNLVVRVEKIGDKYFEARKFPVPLDSDSIGLGAFIRDITEKVRSEEAMKLKTRALEASANAILIMDSNSIIDWVNPAFTEMTGYSYDEAIGNKIETLVRSGLHDAEHYQKMKDTIGSGKVWKGRMINRKKDGSLYYEELTVTPLLDENGKVFRHIAIKQDVSDKIQREKELLIVANVSAALRSAKTRKEMFPIILDQLIGQLNVDAASISIFHPESNEFIIELGRGLWERETGLHIPKGQGISSKVFESSQVYLGAIENDPDIYKPELLSPCKYIAAAPLIVQNNNLGELLVGSTKEIFKKDVRLLSAVADMAANAIHRSTLHERTEEKVRQLNSLRVIDTAINTSLDLRVTFDVVLKQAKQLLHCSALAVLISKSQTMLLEPVANLGFQTKLINNLRFHIGSNIISRSILERETVKIDQKAIPDNEESGKFFIKGEDFITYYAAPLFVKSAVKGLLVALYREDDKQNEDLEEILNTLATQIAIAIDNAELFNGLQHSTADLTFAYNETIEGWAKALELRDQETQGHSRRVTDLTLRLATEMGVRDEKIGHIMRGALLHDIGKMGIPDGILNKPGKLDPDEWDLVKKHPEYAYKMLSSIRYLQPALDIPYCHHEKWDGSGYPRGLKGTEIPLAARIFAIVDVWDALISDRPYRKAWSKSKARDHIFEQSGKHFDPKVVEVFKRIISAET